MRRPPPEAALPMTGAAASKRPPLLLTSGAAGPTEWPVIEADPAERIRLGRRWFNAEFLDRAMRPSLGTARVIEAKPVRAGLGGLSGSSLEKFRLRLDDGRALEW